MTTRGPLPASAMCMRMPLVSTKRCVISMYGPGRRVRVSGARLGGVYYWDLRCPTLLAIRRIPVRAGLTRWVSPLRRLGSAAWAPHPQPLPCEGRGVFGTDPVTATQLAADHEARHQAVLQ